MIKRFMSQASLLNLWRNGTFELQKEGAPAFIDIVGASLNSPESLDVYSLITTNDVVAESSETCIEIVLSIQADVKIQQTFTRHKDTKFDFVAPLSANAFVSLAPGYQSRHEVFIPAGAYTLRWSYSLSGSVLASVYGEDENGAELIFENTDIKALSTTDHWTSESISFRITKAAAKLALRLRGAGSEAGTIRITNMALAAGEYSSLPALPDQFIATFPSNAIILTLGEKCPDGFTELTEIAPLPEWVATNPDVKSKYGNFPRTSNELSGTELHTSVNIIKKPGINDKVEFPGANNLEVVLARTNKVPGSTSPLTTQVPNGGNTIDVNYTNPPADFPGSNDGTPTHQHKLKPAGTRPVARPFLLCKRL